MSGVGLCPLFPTPSSELHVHLPHANGALTGADLLYLATVYGSMHYNVCSGLSTKEAPFLLTEFIML